MHAIYNHAPYACRAIMQRFTVLPAKWRKQCSTGVNWDYEQMYHQLLQEHTSLRNEVDTLRTANAKLRAELSLMEYEDRDTEMQRLRQCNREMAREIMLLGGTQPDAGC